MICFFLHSAMLNCFGCWMWSPVSSFFSYVIVSCFQNYSAVFLDFLNDKLFSSRCDAQLFWMRCPQSFIYIVSYFLIRLFLSFLRLFLAPLLDLSVSASSVKCVDSFPSWVVFWSCYFSILSGCSWVRYLTFPWPPPTFTMLTTVLHFCVSNVVED